MEPIDLKHSRRHVPPKVDQMEVPHSLEAEQAVIGSLLTSPAQCFEATDTARFKKEFFFDLRHAEIFAAMSAMRGQIPIDLITVLQELKDKNQLEAVGGMIYLSALQDVVTSVENIGGYIDIVREKYQLRRSLHVATSHAIAVAQSEAHAEELLCDFERAVLSIRADTETGRGVTDTGTVIDKLQGRYEDAVLGLTKDGVRTGLTDLDEKLGVLKGLIFVAGSPSSGKTSICLQIASHVVFNQELGAGIISLDTQSETVMHRLVTSRAQVNGRLSWDGKLDEDETSQVARALGDWNLRKDKLHICDQGGMDTNQIGSVMRRMYKAGCRYFMVDFLQQVAEKAKSRAEAIGAACQGFKNIANDLGCPLVVISSITKESMKEDKMPTMGDLKESGDIAYHADTIIFLHNKEPEKKICRVAGRIGKSKDGATGSFDLTFFKPEYRFANHVKGEAE